MAGFRKLYVIGGQGGFMGSDGVNPILVQIFVGEGDRHWLEPHYIDANISPIGDVRVIIPSVPDDAQALADACIAFFPEPFRNCPSFASVVSELKGMQRLDFDLEPGSIPPSWNSLRQEAEPILREMNVWQADLTPAWPSGSLPDDARVVLSEFKTRSLRAGDMIQYQDFPSINWSDNERLWRALLGSGYVRETNAGLELTIAGEQAAYRA